MSIRTLVEINHDELSFLLDEREQVFPELIAALRTNDIDSVRLSRGIPLDFTAGIRIICQRHHSEPEWVKSWPACGCRTLKQVSNCKFSGTCSSAHDAVRDVDATGDEMAQASQPTNQLLCMMAGAILGQPEGTCDNRHPYWPQAVEQAQRAHAAFIAHSRREA